MSRNAAFFRSLSVLAHLAASGDRGADLALERIYTLFRCIQNAHHAGDQAWAHELAREAEARVMLCQVLAGSDSQRNAAGT